MDNTHRRHRTQIIPPYDGTCFSEIMRSDFISDFWSRIEYVPDARMRHGDDEGRFLKNHDVFLKSEPSSLSWLQLRRGILLTVGSGCVVLGMVLVVTIIRPETLSTLNTAELGGIVSLIVFPVLTVFAIRYDRSTVSRSLARGYQEPTQDIRVSHTAHNRSGKVNRSKATATTQTQKPRAHQEARGC